MDTDNMISFDSYDLTDIDINNFGTISKDTKDILLLITSGYGIDDIAKIKGIKKDSVRKRLYRLRSNRELKRYLKR